MSTLIDLTGMKFNMLTVIERAESAPGGITYWLCRCDCGNFTTVRGSNLKNGSVKSCGCLQHQKTTNKTHGESYTNLYATWARMKSRCKNESNASYENYGGRGITVCDDWNNDYISFRDWALNNGYEQGLSIDRINNDLGYNPDNCRWATTKQQQNNRRCNVIYSMNGEAHTLSEWCDIYHLNRSTIDRRINRSGMTLEQALTTPIRTYSKG